MRARGVIYDTLIGPFVEFGFMRRALVGALALSLSGAPIGVFLILRRMALTGDAMAHAILPGAALGYLVAGLSLPAMTLGGLAAGLIVAVAAALAARATILREDATLAAFYLISLALGVTIVSLRGSSVDLLRVLFGSVLALDDPTLALLAGISSLTLLALAALYRPLVLETIDPGFFASVSRLAGATQAAFLALVVVNLVAGFHALGTLMSVGLMMLPAASARLWARTLPAMLALSVMFAFGASLAGLIVSWHAGLPSGPLIVLMAGGLYIASLVLGRAGGVLRARQQGRHLEG